MVKLKLLNIFKKNVFGEYFVITIKIFFGKESENMLLR